MKILDAPIALSELKALAIARFGNLVKAVVDIEKGIMAIDAELHADEEAKLLSQGSKQENLWGINLYPDLTGDAFVEFDSMINVRPSAGNVSRGINDLHVQKTIRSIVSKLIKP